MSFEDLSYMVGFKLQILSKMALNLLCVMKQLQIKKKKVNNLKDTLFHWENFNLAY